MESRAKIEYKRGAMTADLWNEQHPNVGVEVIYTPLLGGVERIRTKTRSPAWVLGHGEAVVLVEGKAGGVPLWALEVL